MRTLAVSFTRAGGVKVRVSAHPFSSDSAGVTGVLSHSLVVGHPPKSIKVGMKSKERGRKNLKEGLAWHVTRRSSGKLEYMGT